MNSLNEVRDLLRSRMVAYTGRIPAEQEQKVETVALVTWISWTPDDYAGNTPQTISENIQVMIWFKSGTSATDVLWEITQDLNKIGFGITWSDGPQVDPETDMNKSTLHIRRILSKRQQYNQ